MTDPFSTDKRSGRSRKNRPEQPFVWDDKPLGEAERVVTGEAVALDLSELAVPMRIMSGAVDALVYLSGLLASTMTVMALVQSRNESQAVTVTVWSVVSFLWLLAIPIAVEFFSNGRSVGRFVTGGQVVRLDGGAVRLRHSLVRGIVGLFELWATLGILALLSCAATPRAQRLGDILAGTYVVTIRQDRPLPAPLLMPPGLENWARSADLRPLPPDLSIAAHAFVQRAVTMDIPSRERLGLELAEKLRGYSSAPPVGTHPERFIAAVLVERRNREYAQVLADHETDAALARREAAVLER